MKLFFLGIAIGAGILEATHMLPVPLAIAAVGFVVVTGLDELERQDKAKS